MIWLGLILVSAVAVSTAVWKLIKKHNPYI
jgi:hypothetical protein